MGRTGDHVGLRRNGYAEHAGMRPLREIGKKKAPHRALIANNTAVKLQ